MPIITRGTESVRMQASNPVPISNTNDARMNGDAIAQLGSSIEQAGIKLLETQRDLNINEGKTNLETVYRTGFERAQREAKSDGSDLAALTDKYTTQETSKIIDSTAGWDPKVRRELEKQNTRYKGDVQTNVVINSARMLDADNDVRYGKARNSAGDRIRENPNENLVGAEVRNYNTLIDEQVRNGRMPAVKAQALKQEAAITFFTQYVDGLSNKGADAKALAYVRANQEDPNLNTELTPDDAQSLGLIDSREAQALKDKGEKHKVPVMTKGDKVRLTPELAALSEFVPPEVKSRLVDQLSRKAKEKTELRLSDVRAQISGFKELALAGKPINEADVPKMARDIDSYPNLPPVAKRRLKDELYTAVSVNRTLKEVANSPRSDWQKMLFDTRIDLNKQSVAATGVNADGSPATDYAMLSNRENALEHIEGTMRSMQKEQENDAAGFVLANSQDQQLGALFEASKSGRPDDTKRFVDGLLARQNRLEIPLEKQRILTKGTAQKMAGELSSMPDAGTTNDYISGLEAQYGKHFPRIMREMGQFNDEAKRYAGVTFAPPEVRAAYIDAIKNQPAIEKAFKSADFSESKLNLIDQQIRTTRLADINTALTQSANGSAGVDTMNNLTNAVQLQVKAKLVNNPSLDVKKATQEAYDQLIGSQYSVAKNATSTLVVPKTVNNTKTDAEMVQSFLTVYSKPDNFKDLDIAVPKGYTVEKYSELLGQTAKWINNEDGTGARLIRVNPTNGQRTQVMDKYNRPIERSFDQITRTPGAKVTRENRGILGSLFNSALAGDK